MCFSATDALKGEGLQEGVDWLQGEETVHMNESESVMSWAHSAVWSTLLHFVSISVKENFHI